MGLEDQNNQDVDKQSLKFESNYDRPVLPTRHTLRKSLWINLPFTVYFVLAIFQYYFPFRWVFESFGGYWIFAVPTLFLLNCVAIIVTMKRSTESRKDLPLALVLGLVQLIVIGFFALMILLS